MSKKFVVIVAGGSGSRMKSDVPKQFLLLDGKPVLAHTLSRFEQTLSDAEIILVLPETQVGFWRKLCEIHGVTTPHQVVNGGATRFQSVKNALDYLEGEKGLVAVHDGVRPFVPAGVIREAFETAEITGSAVVAVALKDSVRRLEAGGSVPADRSQFRLVQTPQVFGLELLQQAYAQQESPLFTDDASVYEASGRKVSLVEGSYGNIKITTPEDLWFGEAILKKEKG
ncbi:MAG: 2-C-methyl-D-erythritol 4-phosphate cytidylyltransferase [Cytophagales bacterium]|nr:2-C-methyl-D-erythritol 4-phosphate cytidylyltransferase [Cytophagales bacterium]